VSRAGGHGSLLDKNKTIVKKFRVLRTMGTLGALAAEIVSAISTSFTHGCFDEIRNRAVLRRSSFQKHRISLQKLSNTMTKKVNYTAGISIHFRYPFILSIKPSDCNK